MAKYTEAKCRYCRREGMKLFLKGDRCFTERCAYERRPYAPGQHGRVRKKMSDHGIQLREKQKVRRMYALLEKQFFLTFLKAARQKGVTGENLLSMLESRLDNVVYRFGLAASRTQARQLVSHGFFKLNGKRVYIPSMHLSVGDTISLLDKYKENSVIQSNVESAKNRIHPSWLECDYDAYMVRVKSLPVREEIQVSIGEHLIVEYYSR